MANADTNERRPKATYIPLVCVGSVGVCVGSVGGLHWVGGGLRWVIEGLHWVCKAFWKHVGISNKMGV